MGARQVVAHLLRSAAAEGAEAEGAEAGTLRPPIRPRTTRLLRNLAIGGEHCSSHAAYPPPARVYQASLLPCTSLLTASCVSAGALCFFCVDH